MKRITARVWMVGSVFMVLAGTLLTINLLKRASLLPSASGLPPQASVNPTVATFPSAIAATNSSRTQFLREVLPLGDDESLKTYTSLKVEDFPSLVALLGSAPITNKYYFAAGLALIGLPEGSQPIISEIVSNQKGRTLSDEEERCLEGLLGALGLLASSDDAAWEFLVEGLDREVWRKRRNWKGGNPDGEYGLDRLFRESVDALGATGRQEARALLLKLARRERGYVERCAAQIVWGLFLWDSISRDRSDWLRDFPHDPHDRVLAKYRLWAEGQGKPWLDWLRAVDRHQPVDPPE